MTRTIFLIFISGCLFSCKPDSQIENSSVSNQVTQLEKLHSAIKKDSLNDKLYFFRGKYFYENENYDLAIRDLIHAINLDSTKTKYYHLLSDASMDYYRSKEALLTMKRCVELFPDSIQSLLKYSETQFILKQYDEALATCSRILMRDNQNAEAFFMMGMIFYTKGNTEKAISAFQSSTELDPDIIDSWLMLGEIFEKANSPKALDYFSAAVNVDPSNISALHSKAYYLQNNNQIQEAIEIYRQIIIIDKNYSDAYLNSGILYMNTDSISSALEQFDIMSKTDQLNPLGFFYKGQCFEILKDIEKAKSSYQVAVNLDPKFNRAIEALQNLNN